MKAIWNHLSSAAPILVAGIAAGLALAAPASGFSTLQQWGEAAHGPTPGGGFVFGTGSRHDRGVTCGMCHTNEKGQQLGNLAMTFTPTPAWESVPEGNGYKPGQVYQIAVSMSSSVALFGTGKAPDHNDFAVTIEDQNGVLAGVLASDSCPGGQNCVSTANCAPTFTPLAQLPPGSTTHIYGPACTTVVSIPRQNPALTSWKITWTAPAAGTGPVTLFYGAVDGDAAGTPIRSVGDDVAIGTIKLGEGG